MMQKQIAQDMLVEEMKEMSPEEVAEVKGLIKDSEE